MLVRSRPLVFVSSSIRGLETLRDRIRESIEALGLADAWLFEFHGVASGAIAARQYLQAARDCDLFVLAWVAEVGPGTPDEYEVARADNSEKVLPFFLDSADPESVDLRTEIRDRHRYWPVSATDELPSAIATAVREYLESGAIARPGLSRGLVARRDERRKFLGVPDGFEFQTSLRDTGGHSMSLEVLTAVTSRFVLSGAAGSGKSDFAARSLATAAEEDGRLPLLITASGRGSVDEWIAQTFDEVRFAPGRALIRQYLRDGRALIAVDGLDDLDPDDRAKALRAIAQASKRYPRASIIVLSRIPNPGLPAGFRRGQRGRAHGQRPRNPPGSRSGPASRTRSRASAGFN